MSDDLPRLRTLLGSLKRAGRSSPKAWHKFHLFLRSKKQHAQVNPPVPLILAASGESHASKHGRLSSQLEWAVANDCLDEALRYLETIPDEEWDSCPLEKWNLDSYPRSFDHSESKPTTSAKSAERALEVLRTKWREIAGPEISGFTLPLGFTGAKGRRLVVFAQRDAAPPWGTWTALDHGENGKLFTRFRSAINSAIKPVEVDHIDFVHESTGRST
jgi:hypothetical protein